MGPCSANCGDGYETLTRDWISGENCDKLQQRMQRPCRGKQCGFAVDCKLSEWKNITKCTKSCGGGTQVLQRIVDVYPLYDGKKCPIGFNEYTKITECNPHPCPGKHIFLIIKSFFIHSIRNIIIIYHFSRENSIFRQILI